jgi:hypothetical protein
VSQLDHHIPLGVVSDEDIQAALRPVQRMDNTAPKELPMTSELRESSVDALFGGLTSYELIKREKPEHRQILWQRIRGLSVKEIAAVSGFSTYTVNRVCAQPWFRDAFVRLTTELGKNAVTKFLEGEVMSALERTVGLAVGAESEAVRLAANREILDRFLGKSTVKVEQTVEGKIEHDVVDGAALLVESKRLEEQLKARGIGGTN